MFINHLKPNCSCCDGENIYMVGGYKPQPSSWQNNWGHARHKYRLLRDVWRYNMISKKWMLCTTFGPQSITVSFQNTQENIFTYIIFIFIKTKFLAYRPLRVCCCYNRSKTLFNIWLYFKR